MPHLCGGQAVNASRLIFVADGPHPARAKGAAEALGALVYRAEATRSGNLQDAR